MKIAMTEVLQQEELIHRVQKIKQESASHDMKFRFAKPYIPAEVEAAEKELHAIQMQSKISVEISATEDIGLPEKETKESVLQEDKEESRAEDPKQIETLNDEGEAKRRPVMAFGFSVLMIMILFLWWVL